VLPRVCRVTSVPVTLEQRQMSGALFGGEHAALCHSTAAQILGLIPKHSSAIEIATPRRIGSRPSFVVHQRLWLPGDRSVRVRNLPITSPARTLLDLCGEAHDLAEVALDAALRLEVVTFGGLTDILKLGGRHRIPGTALLRRLLSVRGEDEAMSESELESSVIRVLRRASVSLPERQVTVSWEKCRRLDFFYPEHDLIIEVDGRKWHSSRQRFQDDRRRDSAAHPRQARYPTDLGGRHS
jgi:hypothetical protein